MVLGKRRKKFMLAFLVWMILALFVGNLSYQSTVTEDTKSMQLFYTKTVALPTISTPTSKIFGITRQTNHTLITIIGNANFTSSNGVISGSGTELHPYLIANWIINANDTNHCIEIINTTHYFVIENCTLINASGYAGISLTNVSNGLLLNNECNTSGYGIHLYSSSSITLTSNICNSNHLGIYLSSSSSNTLTSNICYSNAYGIFLSSSSSNTLSNNTCNSNTGVPESSGIALYSSSDTTP